MKPVEQQFAKTIPAGAAVYLAATVAVLYMYSPISLAASKTEEGQIMLPVGTQSSTRKLLPIAQVSNGKEQAGPYTVQGKPVSKEQYDAAKLNDEGLLLMRSNANEQALDKFKQSIALYDGYAEVHHSLALAYAKTGHRKEAIDELKRATELNPNLDESWFLLAGFYQAEGSVQDAVNAYNEYLRRFPNNPMSSKVNVTLGLLYAKLGKNDDAINELKQSMQNNPNLSASWITLGGVYQAKGDLDSAIDAYSSFMQKFPKDPMYSKISKLTEALMAERDRQRKEFGEVQKQENYRLEQEKEVLRQKELKEGKRPGRESESARTGSENQDEQKTSAAKTGRDDYLGTVLNKDGLGVTIWPRTRIPITVYIPEASKASGYRDSFRTILKRSFEDWAKASSGLVAFIFVEKPEIANLKCFWTDRPSDLKNPSEAGDARLFMDQQYISNAEMWFLTQPLSKSMPLTDNAFRVIALHEIGHALGLSGHTTNPEDIMFYSTTFKDNWRELTGRDSRSITRLYKSEI